MDKTDSKFKLTIHSSAIKTHPLLRLLMLCPNKPHSIVVVCFTIKTNSLLRPPFSRSCIPDGGLISVTSLYLFVSDGMQPLVNGKVPEHVHCNSRITF